MFKDPRNTFKGIDKYKTIFWSLRFHGRIFFRNVFVEIKRLWQIDDHCIRLARVACFSTDYWVSRKLPAHRLAFPPCILSCSEYAS